MLNLGKKKDESRLSLADFQVSDNQLEVSSATSEKGGQFIHDVAWALLDALDIYDSDNDCH